jgi:hypothetical protein
MRSGRALSVALRDAVGNLLVIAVRCGSPRCVAAVQAWVLVAGCRMRCVMERRRSSDQPMGKVLD